MTTKHAKVNLDEDARGGLDCEEVGALDVPATSYDWGSDCPPSTGVSSVLRNPTNFVLFPLFHIASTSIVALVFPDWS